MDLADWRWRMDHLYCCREEGSGRRVPFRMRPEQREVIEHLRSHPGVPAIVIKSRRLGLSTGIGTAMVDMCAWTGGTVSTLIERSGKEAGKKMRRILQYAFQSMPAEICNRFEIPMCSTQTMTVKVKGLGAEHLSEIEAGTVARGGDCSFLWISEGGPIAHEDPPRWNEIVSGAWEAARRGVRVVETTWMGGKTGGLWEMVKPLLERDPEAVGKIFFFPWYADPSCVLLDGGTTGKDTEDYFRSIESKLGRQFSAQQRRWWAVTKKVQGIFMGREYPSTLEEAFAAPVEGSIYGSEIDAARADGRVAARIPVDGGGLVHTAWDLGAPLQTVVWYFQIVGRWIRLIDVDRNLDLTITERAATMKAKGYAYGNHFLPHDAKQTDRAGKTLASELARAWLQVDAETMDVVWERKANLKFVPRTHDLWVGINHAKQLLPSCEFRVPECEEALAVLAAYRTAPGTDRRDSGEPLHDWTSHTADAFRTLAEAHLAGMFSFGGAPRPDWQYPSRARAKRGRMRDISLGG